MPLAPPPAPPALELATSISSSTLAIDAGAARRRARTHLHVRRRHFDVLAGRTAIVSGALVASGAPAVLPGRMVSLQALGHHGWQTLARVRTTAGGRYHLRYLAQRAGSRAVRLRFAGDAADRPAYRRLGRLNVYRLAAASGYGGGGRLACGGSLTSSTLGVANKTLPCGALVTLRYHRRKIRVPVVDRGPYVAGRQFDLTQATKRALAFGDTGVVWSTL
jgi:rare lipoprotein A